MGHPRPQFRAKADLPVGFPYRFNSRKWHTHTYPDVRSIRYAVVKKKKKKKKKKLGFEPLPFQYIFSHLMTVFNMFYLRAVAFTLIFVIWISRQCPFIKVCRQRRKTFLLLYCLFFVIKVCRQRRKTFLLLYCLFFVIFFLFFFFSTNCVLRFLCHFSSDLSHIWPVGR